MTKQLEAERRTLLARKRAQQEERRRKAEDLERILLDNQRKVGVTTCIASIKGTTVLGEQLWRSRCMCRCARSGRCSRCIWPHQEGSVA